MFRYFSTICCALLLWSAPASGESQISADDLKQKCQSNDAAEQSFCQGYISGVADAGNICVPEDIKPGTLSDLVASTLQTSAETKQQSPAALIQTRLKQVFPCETAPDKQSKENTVNTRKDPNWSNKERIHK